MNRFILFILWLPFSTQLWAASFPTIRFDGHTDRLYLKEQLYYLNNTELQESEDHIVRGIRDEHFVKNPSWGLPLGYPEIPRQGDYWLALRVHNTTDFDIALGVFGSGTPSLSRMFLINPSTNQIQRQLIFASKLVRAPRSMAIPSGDWKIYIELKRDVYSYPMMFVGLRSYENLVHQSPDRYFIAISVGICLSLLIYNAVLALTLRSVSHIFYVAYNCAVVFYFEANSRILAEQFGTPELPTWSFVPINTASIFSFFLFLYHMFSVPERLPEWRPIFIGFLCSWPIILGTDLVNHALATRMVNGLVLAAFPFTLALGFHAVKRKVPAARALLATIMLPPLGTLVTFLANPLSSWIPPPFIACAQPLGIDLEMVFLSLTVGYKIRQHHLYLRRKRDHAYNELKKIVYPHQVQQIWEGQPLDGTMPVGSNSAFCLVFDVISSSKLPVSDPRLFLSRILRDCSALMMNRYDGQTLTANAYRVKDMGDGFICTVGFPFACPELQKADHSLQLAFDFMRIFRQHALASGAEVPLHCSVGIAYGPVEAYYPESGAQVYDMFGQGIILATRYEGMRDFIFPKLQCKDSIIILQKTVFDQLSVEYQKMFLELALDNQHLTVRDDESASCLYYRLGLPPTLLERAA